MLLNTNMLTKISNEGGGQVLTNKHLIRLLSLSPVLPNPLNFVTPTNLDSYHDTRFPRVSTS